jgi:hypothetical protein
MNWFAAPALRMPTCQHGTSLVSASVAIHSQTSPAVPAALTRRRLKRGVFRSIVDLQAAINRFLREANEHPKPFIWSADPDKIIAAVRRGHQALASRVLG